MLVFVLLPVALLSTSVSLYEVVNKQGNAKKKRKKKEGKKSQNLFIYI